MFIEGLRLYRANVRDSDFGENGAWSYTSSCGLCMVGWRYMFVFESTGGEVGRVRRKTKRTATKRPKRKLPIHVHTMTAIVVVSPLFRRLLTFVSIPPTGTGAAHNDRLF